MSKQSRVIAPPSPVPKKVTHGPRAILAVLLLAAFMASLDVFIVNVAFDRIGASFHGSSIGDVSGVINMTRRIGYVLGVSILVAVLGTPTSYDAAHRAFVHGWWTIAAVEVVAAAACPGIVDRRKQPATP